MFQQLKKLGGWIQITWIAEELSTFLCQNRTLQRGQFGRKVFGRVVALETSVTTQKAILHNWNTEYIMWIVF